MLRLIPVKNLLNNKIRNISNKLILNHDRKFMFTTKKSNNFILGTNSIILENQCNELMKACHCRYRSTTPNAENIQEYKIPKSKKARKSEYIELMEVRTSDVKQRRKKVKKLNPRKISEFILKSPYSPTKKLIKEQRKIFMLQLMEDDDITMEKSTNLCKQPIEYQKINLDMFDNALMESNSVNYDDRPLIFFGKESIKSIDQYKNTEEIMMSLQNFREIIETLKTEENETQVYSNEMKFEEEEKISEFDIAESIDETLIQEEDKTSKIRTKSLTAKTVKEKKFNPKYHRNEKEEKLSKHKSLIINLTSYLNVCISSANLTGALSILLSYRQKLKNKSNQNSNLLLPIELFNILMHGYAEKAAFDKIEKICTILKEDNIKLNHQSYAAIFECLGRVEQTVDNLKLIEKYSEQAKSNKISFNDIMDKSKFQFDQREIILDAIRRIEPDFVPNYTPPSLHYINNLLLKLNENIEEIKSCKNGSDINESYQPKDSQLQNLVKEQLKIELAGLVTVKSIEKVEEFANSELCRKKLAKLQEEWKSHIITGINRDLNSLRTQTKFKHNGLMTYYTYLKSLDTGQYADILINEIRLLAEGSETYSPTVGQLYKTLGRKVQARYQICQKKRNGVLEKMEEIYKHYCAELENCSYNDNPRQTWQRLVYENRTSGPSMDINDVVWPNNVLLGVGRFLYNILMRDIKIDANIMKNRKTKCEQYSPAFYTIFRNQGRLVKEEVKPHPILSRLLRVSQQQNLTFESNMVPMLCPPQPWSTPVNGGYLVTKTELIRLPQQAFQQLSRINEAKTEDLYPALDSLNQLSNIPWRINTDLLDVILEVFNNGGDSKLDVPQPPSSLPFLPSESVYNSNLNNIERAKLYKEKLGHRRKQAEMYSMWCDTLYRLSLANHYRDKTFWLPHNMDFRGRVYPVPPHLNHLGSDLARSMLIFDQPKPLGEDGFSWLKLHCINLTGLKKRDSIRERLLYAEEVMEEILDSADNPLTGRRWWAKSDEPWQTLGCCKEIAKVSRCSDPTKYMSHFPIHQDGSCNGLQHYAALGRDQVGAISVNLVPADVPQDVYSAVAHLVERNRKFDAESGLHVAQILDGYVKRKVIKQTVMTTVYGVTRYGARLQIAKQLKDIDDFPKEWVWPASTYLTKKTFESLREMFTSTKEIQDWFTDCARLISATCAQNVEWITPLGLPVVQPYNRQEQFNKGSLAKCTVRIKDIMSIDTYEKPNIMKQKNAFPPNFIHSLDSSHMMLTSLHCERHGITFISVHDCFWTHACTVPDMNKICREQFVALHSQPILEELSKFMVEKYSYREKDLSSDGSVQGFAKRRLNITLNQLPKKGDFDLNQILKSVYFFS